VYLDHFERTDAELDNLKEQLQRQGKELDKVNHWIAINNDRVTRLWFSRPGRKIPAVPA